MNWLEAIIISIVEGITEFLPISSTGHMILTQGILGMESNDFVKAFIINIQFGAILSVVVLYWRNFIQSFSFYLKLLVAFMPAAVIGFVLDKYIDALLENVYVVSVMLILGGIVLLFIDKWFKNPSENQEISYPAALKIGFFQCIAMIPGVSRSAATIIGGMAQKLTRKTAAEFSFFLAVPTMFVASGYKLMTNYQSITTDNIDILITGNIVAFIVAMIAIKSFISYLTKHGFKVFGYYRIALGILILVLIASGFDLTIG
ncbi:MAG: undecaprenyl-diphosphate phosphatase [Bacteroidetes bacterium]|nr:undecaprenyl-diphosphate phosphatase [Bacteroidota bacterium]